VNIRKGKGFVGRVRQTKIWGSSIASIALDGTQALALRTNAIQFVLVIQLHACIARVQTALQKGADTQTLYHACDRLHAQATVILSPVSYPHSVGGEKTVTEGRMDDAAKG